MVTVEAAVALGFVAGIASFFTPCAVGMVPAYLGYFLGREQGVDIPKQRRILNGALFGLVTTLGFVTLFGLAGLALTGADAGTRNWIGSNFPYIAIGAGALLILFGILVLLNVPMPLSLPIKAPQRRNILGFYIFGLAYGLVSFSCNLPLFLAVVLSALLLGGPAGILAFVAYALGKGTMMTLASLLVAVPKESLDVKSLVRLTPKIKKLSGAALAIGGVAMIGYYAYLLWYLSRPVGGT